MRLGGIAHNFWGRIGSVVAAVLPTTHEIYEPTMWLRGAIRRNCQGEETYYCSICAWLETGARPLLRSLASASREFCKQPFGRRQTEEWRHAFGVAEISKASLERQWAPS